MTHLVLVRHGQTNWNVEGRWQGQADPPLNAHGRAQAWRAGLELSTAGLQALFSSDLQRSAQTARIIGDRVGLRPVFDSRLREIHLGRWQGMLSFTIETGDTQEFTRWLKTPLAATPPGGETLVALAVRVMEVVSEIVVRYPAGSVGIVSHELPIAVIRCRAANVSLAQVRDFIPENGAWSEVDLGVVHS